MKIKIIKFKMNDEQMMIQEQIKLTRKRRAV